MKQTANQYVALDVHQATLVVSVRDETGSVRMRATMPTEEKSITNLLGGLSGRIFVAFEEGTQSQWLHDVIKPHAERVVVCNSGAPNANPAHSFSAGAILFSVRVRAGELGFVRRLRQLE